ncbi:MAG: response regulator [Acidobacteriota bacterium]
MTAKSKVLIVDDDQDYRASVRALLESRGFEVVEAESGSEGLRKLPQVKPSLIVLDVIMSSCCDGYGFTWAVKNKDEYSEFRNVPILMTSSIEDSPDERFAMCPEAGMIRPDYYLTKPLDIARFLETVERA